MLLISIRKKHLTFWLILLIVGAGLRAGYNQISANITPFYQVGGGIFSQQLTITSQAKAYLGDRDISFALEPGTAQDQPDGFFYKFLDNSGTSYSRLELTVILPSNLAADLVKVEPILTYSQINEAVVKKSGNQIVITGFEIAPQALFSLNLFIPRGYLSFPWHQTAWQFIKNEKISFWLGVSILFPAIALAGFLIVTHQQRRLRKQLKTSQIISQPASRLNPALVDILYHNRATAKSIASFLVNLANKGLIEMVFKDEEFSFSQLGLKAAKAEGRIDLEPAEKVILSKLFKGEKFKAEEREVRFRVAHRLFSGKMALFYYLLYHQTFEKGFFIQEPAAVHRHYQNWGLIFFFLGVAGMGINVLFAPASMAVLWLGLVLAGILFIRLSSRISFLSQAGLKELQKWLAFRNYLMSDQPLGGQAAEKRLLFDYLPYALVLDCEQEWLARFSNQPFTPPQWYVSFDSDSAQENFENQLLGLLKWLSESLTYAKDPSVE